MKVLVVLVVLGDAGVGVVVLAVAVGVRMARPVQAASPPPPVTEASTAGMALPADGLRQA